jgi:prepilin signal peptidase PulO-like enzyme (type II secretory pathway)
VYLLWRLVRGRRDRASLASIALPMMLAVFAGALLGKILWNVRAVHYGFALALPATVLVLNSLIFAGSRYAEARGGSPQFVRAVWAALVLVGCYAHFRVDYAYFQKKEHVVSAGGDAFLADIRGKMISEATNYLLETTRPDQTLVAMPEGFLLNYLSRRVNPTIYHQFTPPNLIMYGEDNILAELQKHPPDVIALVHVDNIEYDARFFGKDYGLKIWDWVTANYSPMAKPDGQTALFGFPPFVDAHSGVLLVQRNR